MIKYLASLLVVAFLGTLNYFMAKVFIEEWQPGLDTLLAIITASLFGLVWYVTLDTIYHELIAHRS